MSNQSDLDAFSEEILDIVSKNVIRIRIERGYSQLKLALEMGLSGAGYLGRMELRKNGLHFNISHIAKISKIFAIDINEFFQEN